ncbi:MAG: hypothetical protein OEY49_14440 [Candidatus Heimdallarchaeota archaeon]|nr:hypothetical protein [Candidatus Heimdallarchaeota archaeon]
MRLRRNRISTLSEDDDDADIYDEEGYSLDHLPIQEANIIDEVDEPIIVPIPPISSNNILEDTRSLSEIDNDITEPIMDAIQSMNSNNNQMFKKTIESMNAMTAVLNKLVEDQNKLQDTRIKPNINNRQSRSEVKITNTTSFLSIQEPVFDMLQKLIKEHVIRDMEYQSFMNPSNDELLLLSRKLQSEKYLLEMMMRE